MSFDPSLAGTEIDCQTIGCELETVTVLRLNAVANHTAEVVTEILCGVGSVKSFRIEETR